MKLRLINMRKYVGFAFAMLLLTKTMTTHASTPLETALLDSVRAAHFERVVDFGAGNENRPVKAHLGLVAQTVVFCCRAIIRMDSSCRSTKMQVRAAFVSFAGM